MQYDGEADLEGHAGRLQLDGTLELPRGLLVASESGQTLPERLVAPGVGLRLVVLRQGERLSKVWLRLRGTCVHQLAQHHSQIERGLCAVRRRCQYRAKVSLGVGMARAANALGRHEQSGALKVHLTGVEQTRPDREHAVVRLPSIPQHSFCSYSSPIAA